MGRGGGGRGGPLKARKVKKLDPDGKRELAEKLMAEAAEMEAKAPAAT